MKEIALKRALRLMRQEWKQDKSRASFHYAFAIRKSRIVAFGKNNLLDASSDLGAKNFHTFKSVVLPLIFPSIIAGSMFTFSLSLGDYITAQIIGGKLQMLGNVVYQNFSINLPFAATIAAVPVLIMAFYLWLVRRTGALADL